MVIASHKFSFLCMKEKTNTSIIPEKFISFWIFLLRKTKKNNTRILQPSSSRRCGSWSCCVKSSMSLKMQVRGQKQKRPFLASKMLQILCRNANFFWIEEIPVMPSFWPLPLWPNLCHVVPKVSVCNKELTSVSLHFRICISWFVKQVLLHLFIWTTFYSVSF